MGLDMYLTAERYLWSSSPEDLAISKQVQNMLGLNFHQERGRVRSITAEAMYWRKANSIHNWFVENVQGGEDTCESYFVSREQLLELLAQCKAVAKKEVCAHETLPTTEGFFFGSTDYNEYYWQDINDTIMGLEMALDTFDEDWDFSYRASW